MNHQQSFIPSPCIRKCGLDEHDICRGCFRSITEIVNWEAMNSEQRQQTLENCRQRCAQRTGQRF